MRIFLGTILIFSMSLNPAQAEDESASEASSLLPPIPLNSYKTQQALFESSRENPPSEVEEENKKSR